MSKNKGPRLKRSAANRACEGLLTLRTRYS